MKTIKLDHHLAELVQKGLKTSTWRLYDDKDISVNDVIELLDKVSPKDPATWKPIGKARVNSIIQKRLGDIDTSDYEGHEVFESFAKMIETFRSYYGPQVDKNTAVKIIRFSMLGEGDDPSSFVDNNTMILTDVKLYADGGSRGNPGPSATGFVITDEQGNVVVKKGLYLGVTTNNQAEYQALKSGLEEAERMQSRQVHVFMDSLLVINQMLGIFKVKNRDLWPIHNAVQELAKHFKKVTYTHIPRELNKLADAAVNEALDEAAE